MMKGAVPIPPEQARAFRRQQVRLEFRPCVLSVSSCCPSGVSLRCWGIRVRTLWRTGWVFVVTSKQAFRTSLPVVLRTQVTFAHIVRRCMVGRRGRKISSLLIRPCTIRKTVVSANGCSRGSRRCPRAPQRSRNNPGSCCSGCLMCGRFSIRRCRPSPVVRQWRDPVEDCADHL